MASNEPRDHHNSEEHGAEDEGSVVRRICGCQVAKGVEVLRCTEDGFSSFPTALQ